MRYVILIPFVLMMVPGVVLAQGEGYGCDDYINFTQQILRDFDNRNTDMSDMESVVDSMIWVMETRQNYERNVFTVPDGVKFLNTLTITFLSQQEDLLALTLA